MFLSFKGTKNLSIEPYYNRLAIHFSMEYQAQKIFLLVNLAHCFREIMAYLNKVHP